MAGKKGRSGGRPKPTALHISQGTHRADRHGPIDSQVEFDPEIEKPNFECPYAEAMWNKEVQATIDAGIVTKVDGPLLRSACDLWGLYMMSCQIATNDPTDRDARIAVTAYWAKFEQAAARFGWNPSDRSRLKIEKPKASGIQARKRD